MTGGVAAVAVVGGDGDQAGRAVVGLVLSALQHVEGSLEQVVRERRP